MNKKDPNLTTEQLLEMLSQKVAEGTITSAEVKAAAKRPDNFMRAGKALREIQKELPQRVDWSDANAPAARITFVMDFMNNEPECTAFSIEVLEASAGTIPAGTDENGKKIRVPAKFTHPETGGRYASRVEYLHKANKRVKTHLVYQQSGACDLEKVPANQKEFERIKKEQARAKK